MDNTNDVKVEEKSSAPVAKDNKVVMGILSYLGILIIIPYMTAKNDPFVKFHIKQGLVLLVIEVILWIIGSIFLSYALWQLINLLDLAILVLVIIGIVNVVNKQEKELPVVGQFSHYFKF